MFKLPDRLKTTIPNYGESLNEYLEGKISPDRFRGIRVPYGFYSERESNVLLSRVRIPGGCVTSSQLRALADAGDMFNARLHVTDRQDVQIHDVTYEDSVKVLGYLKDFELSSIGGGGNTVRNVTACPMAGFCKEEVFDCTGHAVSVSEYLLEDPLSIGKLPRKFKVAFSGCGTDCAFAMVNDVGLIAKEKDGVKGFRAYTGGGMGASSAVGRVLEEFVPEEKVGYVVKAVMLTYEKHGDKFNRHRNRLRFLIQQIGFDRFRELYLESLAHVLANEKFRLKDPETNAGHSGPNAFSSARPAISDNSIALFLKNNVKAQRQEGLYSVELSIPQGDIENETLRRIADLERIIPGIGFRFTQQQNILLYNIPGRELNELYSRLKEIFGGDDFIIQGNLMNVVACKGATTCNLGLCNSPGIARAVLAELEDSGLNAETLKEFNVKISGCPNNCGQHSLGIIGLQGIARKSGQHPVPLYKILAGGRTGEGTTRLAHEVGKVPAKVVPALLKEYLSEAQHRIKNYKSVHEFLDAEGAEMLKALTDKYSYIPAYNENQDFYVDWERKEDFTLAGLGPAECGAGVLDLIEADLAEAGENLKLAKNNDYQGEYLKKALVYSARALLVVRGIEPKDDLSVIDSFISEFVDKGIAEQWLAEIKNEYNNLLSGHEGINKIRSYGLAERFHQAIKALYKAMDSHFRFPEVKKEEAATPETLRELDLKGVKCPYNYIRAKLYLEELEKDSTVMLFLDDGEPIRNVPQSLENDGYHIISKERTNGHYSVLVRK